MGRGGAMAETLDNILYFKYLLPLLYIFVVCCCVIYSCIYSVTNYAPLHVCK